MHARHSTRSKLPRRKATVVALLSALGLTAAGPAAADEYTRLLDLLAATPGGGWVKADLNDFSNAWPTGADRIPNSGDTATYANPAGVVQAWSSFAWDSARGNLLLWGGGHANYAGNEMYVWDGQSGNWGLGSLPTRVGPGPNYVLVDNTVPASAHTYDNNLYLPVNDMFVTFGGAAFPAGGEFVDNGPYVWDPRKADPLKVGGVTGSGYNTTTVRQGGAMWDNRADNLSTANNPPVLPGSPHINGTTAYRTENGKDVVYFTADGFNSGFPTLYRYEFGDIRNGGQDTLERAGIPSFDNVSFKGAGTIDTRRGLYVRTTNPTNTTADGELIAWNLDPALLTDPEDIKINLVNPNGTAFMVNGDMGIDYLPETDTLLLWDGREQGVVWYVDLPDGGGLGTGTWTVQKVLSATIDQPNGNVTNGVLGKWKYVPQLGAFVALDGYASGDAGVWLYRPLGVVPIPEPETYALLLAGLGIIAAAVRRRRV